VDTETQWPEVATENPPARFRTPTFATSEVHTAISQFLAFEASLLDQDRLFDWLDLLDDAFVYIVPLRRDHERKQGGNRFMPAAYRVHDTKAALRHKVERLSTGHAWVEELASRTSRLLGVAVVLPTDVATDFAVTSSIVVYRQRGDQRDFEIIPGRHEDIVRRQEDGAFRLLRREVYLTEKCLSTNNLAILV